MSPGWWLAFGVGVLSAVASLTLVLAQILASYEDSMDEDEENEE